MKSGSDEETRLTAPYYAATLSKNNTEEFSLACLARVVRIGQNH